MGRHSDQIRSWITDTGNLLREILLRLFPVLGTLYTFSHAATALYLCARLTGGYLHWGGCVPHLMWILLFFLAALGVSYLADGRVLFCWKGLKKPVWIAVAAGVVVALLAPPVMAAVAILAVTAGLALEYLRTVSLRASVYLIRICGWREEPGDNRRYLPWVLSCALICFAALRFSDLSAALGYYLAWNVEILWPWMLAGICVRRM